MNLPFKLDKNHSVEYDVKIKPIIFRGIASYQLCFINQREKQDNLQLSELYLGILLQSSSNLLTTLETDYAKWNNMVQLKIIKEYDLKLLSFCIFEGRNIHNNLINLIYLVNLQKKGNNKVSAKEIQIRNVIIHTIEVFTVKNIERIQ